LMRDASGASFLTAIDTVAHPDICAWLARHCPVRTLDNLTNNFVEPRQALIDDPQSHTKSRAVVAGNMIEFVQRFGPRRAVISGQGWSFAGAKAGLNKGFFSVDNQWLARAAGELAPHVEWFEGIPGMRFTLRGGGLSVDESGAVPAITRSDRTFDPQSVRTPQAYAPWTGVMEIPAARLARIGEFICERYGQILLAHAPRLAERLYYLKCQGAGDFSPALAITVRNAESYRIYELDYGHLLFRDVTSSAPPCAVGFEIWASDFELLLGAAEEAFMVCESAVRTWSFVPEAIDAAMLSESFMWFTPRFRPEAFLAFYRSRIAALLEGTTPAI
jgi:hypothetical protein